MRMVAKVIAALFSGIAILSAVALLVLFSIDFNEHKAFVEEQVKDLTGRDLVIHGELDVSLSLFTPRLRVSDVEFLNAPWANEPVMLEVGELEIDLDLSRLPFDRLLEVNHIKINDATLHIQRDDYGQLNFPSTEEAPVSKHTDNTIPIVSERGLKPKEPIILPIIHAAEINRLKVTYADTQEPEKRIFNLYNLTVTESKNVGKRSISLEGDASSIPFFVEGETGSFSELFDEELFWPFTLTGDVAGVQLDLNGNLQNPRKAAGANADIFIMSNDISKFSALSHIFGGFDVPDLGSTELSATLKADEQGRLAAQNLYWSVNKSGKHRVVIDGAVDDIIALNGIHVSTQAEIQSINEFIRLLVTDFDYPELGQLAVDTKLSGGLENKITLSDITATLIKKNHYSAKLTGDVGDVLKQSDIKIVTEASVSDISELSSYLNYPIPSLGHGSISAKINGDYPANLNLNAFDLHVKSGQKVDAKLTGSIQNLLSEREMNLDYNLKLADVSQTAQKFGLKLPGWKNVKLEGDLSSMKDEYFDVKNFMLQVQDSDISGHVQISLKKDVPEINAVLSSQRIVMGDLRKSQAHKLKTAAKSRETVESHQETTSHLGRKYTENRVDFKEPTKPRVKLYRLSKAEIDLSKLKSANVNLDVSINKLVEGDLAISPLNVKASLINGNLKTQKLELGDGDGHLAEGYMNFDTSSGQIDTDIVLKAKEFNVDALLSVVGYTKLINGDVQVSLDLKTKGKSPQQLASNMQGHVQMAMANGVMNADSITKYFGAGAAVFTELFTGGQADDGVKIYCFIADYPIEQGIMKTKSLLFDSSVSTITSTGTVDLGEEEIDLVVTPQGDILGIGAALPVIVSGDFRKFNVYPDPAGTVASLTGTVLSGVLFPFSVAGSVLPLNHKDSPCTGANAKAKTREAERGESIINDLGTKAIEGIFNILGGQQD
ncbi:AsmA family protein [Curvivirga aplysinae]|uniref:AsmA family protein n=1 Tax=Curvivirga aplysinae TaxID=2529852 RepID=UPI0012BD2345|nr:AsmA family protein [Curvivirga aplysinae]MTI11274.1 AsmA family protein [Curvivirga aplysinae]